MKKILAAFLVLAVLLTGVWAGGSGESSKGVERLEILLSDDTLEGGAMAKAVERFNAEYADKGIEVYINEIAYGDMQTQIQNRAMAGDLPALIRSGHFLRHHGGYAGNGTVLRDRHHQPGVAAYGLESGRKETV